MRTAKPTRSLWRSPSGRLHAQRRCSGSAPIARLTRATLTPDELARERAQGIADVRGRAHDVLWMASLAARAGRDASGGHFHVILPTRGTRRRVHVLKVCAGAGDNGELVITLMLPGED